MTTPDEIARLRHGLKAAIGYLSHFKDDAECKMVSFPDTIQQAMDDLQAVLDGGNAGDRFRSDRFRRAFDFHGEPPALDRAAQFR
jgi:hypothetical protein